MKGRYDKPEEIRYCEEIDLIPRLSSGLSEQARLVLGHVALKLI